MKIIQYYYELPSVNLEDDVKQVFQMHGIQTTDRQNNYILQFLSREANEPRIAKHILHQFCTSILLSGGAQTHLRDDSSEINLLYLFVASFLLVTYPELFLNGNVDTLIRNVWDGSNAMVRGNRERHQEVVNELYIRVESRNRLEAVMRNAIVTGKEASPPSLIDHGRLSAAVKLLRQR